MIDIIIQADGLDLGIVDSQTPRAANILSVQFGSLAYAQDLGIDLAFFLKEDFRFENAAFKSYLIETLANRGINVADLLETVESLYSQYSIQITPEETTTALIAR